MPPGGPRPDRWLHDGVRNGEDYDARLEMPGWDTAAFDDSAWAEPQVVDGPKGVLCARDAAADPRHADHHARRRDARPKPGVFVFDMGQNFAGWAQLKVSGPAGTQVTMRYGERLSGRRHSGPQDDRRLRPAGALSDRYLYPQGPAARRSGSRVSPITASARSK